ncbi:MAG: hypothetical protein KatS3mg105_3658 [Gemmatales bacterium]|nr:MAG: hypothetical protein KatS3mg105_3658 [Gemmatales bacterium]
MEVNDLPESARKEIFEKLVAAQDANMSVPQSRRYVADQFGINLRQVQQIEREGLDRLWPPLSDDQPPHTETPSDQTEAA